MTNWNELTVSAPTAHNPLLAVIAPVVFVSAGVLFLFYPTVPIRALYLWQRFVSVRVLHIPFDQLPERIRYDITQGIETPEEFTCAVTMVRLMGVVMIPLALLSIVLVTKSIIGLSR